MRCAFSRSLVGAALLDRRILLLTGDHGYALFDEFRQACPGQYLNAGVAEQNMVGVAAGLAKGGFRPVVYGLSAFVPIRVLEQIKLDVCYERLPVLFIGDGAGVVYSTLGTSHQSTEDLSALRALPHLALLSPADDQEMTACMALALSAGGPVYLRMGKADLGRVHSSVPKVAWGEPCLVRAGAGPHEETPLLWEAGLPGPGPLAWLATGSMVHLALAASRHWPGSAVWSIPSIKPLNEAHITTICRQYPVIVVLEEHSVLGGLGSAVAEISSSQAPTWVCRIGIQDRFSQHCGSYSYLMREHQLDLESVLGQVERFLSQCSLSGSLPPLPPLPKGGKGSRLRKGEEGGEEGPIEQPRAEAA